MYPYRTGIEICMIVQFPFLSVLLLNSNRMYLFPVDQIAMYSAVRIPWFIHAQVFNVCLVHATDVAMEFINCISTKSARTTN